VRALLEAGINGMAKVPSSDGMRRPAILIRSSPWKAGTEQTPWHDVFDMDNGHVRYFGDHKAGLNIPPGTTTGNAALLDAFTDHQGRTPDERAAATPLLLFRTVPRTGKPKGHVALCGLGVIERTERLVQWGGREHTPFVNYVYDIALIDLTSEDDTVDWEWIEARRDKGVSHAQALALAPWAWREWVKHGSSALPGLRRRVARAPGRQSTRSTPEARQRRSRGLGDGLQALRRSQTRLRGVGRRGGGPRAARGGSRIRRGLTHASVG
jgi:hypothetical protein